MTFLRCSYAFGSLSARKLAASLSGMAELLFTSLCACTIILRGNLRRYDAAYCEETYNQYQLNFPHIEHLLSSANDSRGHQVFDRWDSALLSSYRI